jgi:hypothetical protein
VLLVKTQLETGIREQGLFGGFGRWSRERNRTFFSYKQENYILEAYL